MNRNARGHFNLIHEETGFKAYIYLTGNTELQLWAMQNSKQIDSAGSKTNTAPPEYVIIMKLEFYKEGNAQKHLSDIKAVLVNSGEQIDFVLLNTLIAKKDLHTEWKAVQ